MTLGLKMRGLMPAQPIAGREWRWMRNVGWSLSPPGPPLPISTGLIVTGDNLFANSVIALKADTGERVWHFQGVKHDIWDRDFDSPPTLVTIKRNGKTIDAVAQTIETRMALFARSHYRKAAISN